MLGSRRVRGAWGVLTCALLLGSACRSKHTLSYDGKHSASPPEVDPSVWPNAWPRELPAPRGDRLLRVYLDAGHGADHNTGAESTFCTLEEDFTLALAYDVAATLEELGGFEVALSRTGSRKVPYADRVTEADALVADVFVSLHADVRGTEEAWSPDGVRTCRRSVDAPGFSVLFSDEGDETMAQERQRFASATARTMRDAGFLPFEGADYHAHYAPIEPGVFVDRHEPDKRIFVLRRTTMPAILVETHNGLDPREVEAWEDPVVRRAFALSLAVAIANTAGDAAREPAAALTQTQK